MEVWEGLATLTLSLAVIMAVVSIVRSIARSRQMNTALEKKGALQHEILKQFSGGEELSHFLNSPAGGDFVASAQLPADDNPYTSILRSVRGGIVAVALGVTMILLNDQVGGRGMHWFGVLVAVGGAAVLVAAGVSYGLSRKWGLLPSVDADEDLPSIDA